LAKNLTDLMLSGLSADLRGAEGGRLQSHHFFDHSTQVIEEIHRDHPEIAYGLQ